MEFLLFSRVAFYALLFIYVMILMQEGHMLLQTPSRCNQSSVWSQMKEAPNLK
jgi:hypothetical protein